VVFSHNREKPAGPDRYQTLPLPRGSAQSGANDTAATPDRRLEFQGGSMPSRARLNEFIAADGRISDRLAIEA
jgi:hypothetical protein